MRKTTASLLGAFAALTAGAANAALCVGYGPQTPRDITDAAGANPRVFSPAPPASELNLCNIHTHTNAEHKGPEFTVFAGPGPDGGFECDAAASLTEAERSPMPGAYAGAAPGQTIEVHWVYSSCDVAPGEGLGACLSDKCANPQLRVEAQVFLVVNDPAAADIGDFDYSGEAEGGLHQPKALPEGGEPVVFAGSTTGPSYDAATCSPLQVTWSVRPSCQKIHIGSLHEWAEDNAFAETKSHGVRALVTAPELLSPIE
ncbi:MAG: delta-class carbonic anhydrase [Pseudomonadota bacterium]